MRLQEAADMLGVHYQTAYGWVRAGRLPARMVAGGYDIAEADVRAFSAERRLGREPTSTIQVRDWASQANRLYRAIADGQETAVRRAMERLAGHVTVTDLCDRVIAPALRRIGEDWEAGCVSIAQEHRATAICERLIAAQSSQPAGRPRGTAVVTTPQDERHALPCLMAAACLRENHWHVHHLACDLPAPEISALAAAVSADLVVLSTATDQGARRAAEAAELLRTHLGIVVLVGHAGETLNELRNRATGPHLHQPVP
ncbi:MAG TPA: B12-binding domain-containing protein [Streptosporangiaceae bacterium]|nr:B12-binding domain-containing protein [Streptosporangiaceae bacterium]